VNQFDSKLAQLYKLWINLDKSIELDYNSNVSENRYTSVYLPRELKCQLVDTAQSEGFEVTRGRKSRLAQFIAVMVEEHNLLSQSDPAVSSLHSLTPELRSFVLRLSKMGKMRQKRACAMLELLLADWQEQEIAHDRHE
jgi:hypothetical protein